MNTSFVQVSKDATVKQSKDEAEILKIAEVQKRLLLAAIDSCDHASKTGGAELYGCRVYVTNLIIIAIRIALIYYSKYGTDIAGAMIQGPRRGGGKHPFSRSYLC